MNIKEHKISSPDFLPELLGSFAKPAAENPTVAIMEAAFRHHQLHCRYINCEVGPENLQAQPLKVPRRWDGGDSTAPFPTKWKS